MVTTFDNKTEKLARFFLLDLRKINQNKSIGLLEDLVETLHTSNGITDIILSISSDNTANMLHLGHIIDEKIYIW